MKIQRTQKRLITEVCSVELDEISADRCYKYLQSIAENPNDVPEITPATLAQSWHDPEEGYLDLYTVKLTVKRHGIQINKYLTDLIVEWIEEELWNEDKVAIEDIVDSWTDESIHDIDEYAELIYGTGVESDETENKKI